MQLRKYYPDAAESLPSSTWDIMERFWNLDLSPLNSLMQDCYSVFGPAPRQPSDMLRSILLSVEFKIPTVTQWCAELRHNHLYAILSGFPVGSTPGIGTFYDFFHRLWKSDKPDIRNPIHSPKRSPKKPDKKGVKAPPVDKIRIEDLLSQLQENPPVEADPCSLLFEIFSKLFLFPSAEQGLIDLKQLALSGDGTPVYTAAQQRKNACATVWRTGFMIVIAPGNTLNRIVILDGILTETAITSAMICTCLLPATQKTIFRFFLCWVLLPDMISMV